MSSNQFGEFLYQALSTKYGIAINTANPQGLIQKLHQARAKAGDASLKALVIAISRADPDHEVWIIKKPEPKGAEEKPEAT